MSWRSWFGLREPEPPAPPAPPCAHQWRVLFTSVTAPVELGAVRLSVTELSIHDVREMQTQRLKALQGSTFVLIACDNCGARVVLELAGIPFKGAPDTSYALRLVSRSD
jgi:hypothetical protein